MHSETELRRLLAATEAPPVSLDLPAVIRRSSRRRRTRKVAVGAATVLAVVGISFAGITGIQSIGPMGVSGASSAYSGGSAARPEWAPPLGTGADTGAADGATANGTGAGEGPMSGPGDRRSAASLNLCGRPLAVVVPAASGLVVSASFAAAAASAALIHGTVTLTNSGSDHIVGSSAPTPTITLSKNGRTLWHSSGAAVMSAAVIDLRPGQSMTLRASFSPVECSPADDKLAQLPPGLPPVPAGTYQVSAAIDVTIHSADGTSPGTTLVTGPESAVILY